MNVARILYPVEVLGPGKRIGIWLCGCNNKCKGCSNPELWVQQDEYEISVTDLCVLIDKIMATHNVEGITITGGEPFLQAEELREFLSYVKQTVDDILIYSGYTLKELKEQKDFHVNEVLKAVSVLIDGRYIEGRNHVTPLRGSDNQVVYFFNEELRNKYESFMKKPNRVQNFPTSDGFISVGIHDKEYRNKLKRISKEKGLVIEDV